MGLDLLVCCVFAYWLVKHSPELVGEAAQSFAAGLRGEESPAMAARRIRLEEAGIDPATGGAFRQYAGNLWRDFWLDQDAARTRRRGDGYEAERDGLAARLRRAFDDEVDRRSRAWQRRSEGRRPRPTTGTDETRRPTPDTSGGQDRPDVSPDTAWDEPETAEPTAPTDEPTPPPMRVPATVGAPVDDTQADATATFPRPLPLPAPTERNRTMTQAVGTNPTAVTGVVSGANEARNIVRYLEQATQAYEAAMAQARKRIHALGEQTIGIVQLASRSRVVDATAQAAESIAAAQAGVNRCQAETIPLLNLAAREFDRLNS